MTRALRGSTMGHTGTQPEDRPPNKREHNSPQMGKLRSQVKVKGTARRKPWDELPLQREQQQTTAGSQLGNAKQALGGLPPPSFDRLRAKCDVLPSNARLHTAWHRSRTAPRERRYAIESC